MKIFILSFLIMNFTACFQIKNKSAGFSQTLRAQKKLSVFHLNYGASDPTQQIFLPGYGIIKESFLDKATIQNFSGFLADSSNYIKNKSQNCVLAARYGFRFANDSTQFTVLIGTQPCLKMLIQDEHLRKETIFDLTENNTITPFLTELFATKK